MAIDGTTTELEADMPCTSKRFSHQGAQYEAVFEPFTVKGRQRVVWALYLVTSEGRETLATGSHTDERGCYSIDRQTPGVPDDELLQAMMDQYYEAKRVPTVKDTCDCKLADSNRVVKQCDVCAEVERNNAAVAEGVRIRERLFDPAEDELLAKRQESRRYRERKAAAEYSRPDEA